MPLRKAAPAGGQPVQGFCFGPDIGFERIENLCQIIVSGWVIDWLYRGIREGEEYGGVVMSGHPVGLTV